MFHLTICKREVVRYVDFSAYHEIDKTAEPRSEAELPGELGAESAAIAANRGGEHKDEQQRPNNAPDRRGARQRRA